MHFLITIPCDRLGIDEINGCAWRNAASKSCSGINVQAGTDDYEQIGFRAFLDSFIYFRNSFAKPDDERTKLASVVSKVAHFHFIMFRVERLDVARVIRRPTARYLHQFAMKMYDIW